MTTGGERPFSPPKVTVVGAGAAVPFPVGVESSNAWFISKRARPSHRVASSTWKRAVRWPRERRRRRRRRSRRLLVVDFPFPLLPDAPGPFLPGRGRSRSRGLDRGREPDRRFRRLFLALNLLSVLLGKRGLTCYRWRCSTRSAHGLTLCESGRTGSMPLRCSSLPETEGTQNTGCILVDPASSHMLVSKIKPCMSKFTPSYGETANGSLNQSRFLR